MAKSSIRSDIPSQAGRLAVVTGASGGLGFQTALALAAAGAEVVVAARSEQRGEQAAAEIRLQVPGAKASFALLDLASLDSVAAFASRLVESRPSLELLINNAGVMALSERQTTADGFEKQFGTNYLGHFALTGRLLPLLRHARDARVISLGSVAHRRGAIDFADLQSERNYAPWRAYAQSKLAMLMFAMELQRRSDSGGWGLTSLAAHPGWARTDLIAKGPGYNGRAGLLWRLSTLLAPFLGQSAPAGALPVLFAATSPLARGGAYYGPTGPGELRGRPGPAKVAPQAASTGDAARLWEASESLTGVRYADLTVTPPAGR